MELTPVAATTTDGVSIQAEMAAAGDASALCIVCHPHPLYGGDMHNPVPATLFARLPRHGISVVRCNFRGVGASTGQHGNGAGEQLDLLAVIEAATSHCSQPLTLVGYSFGADVVLATDHAAVVRRVAVAPPLAVFDTFAAAASPAPTTVMIPTQDQMIPPDRTRQIVAQWPTTDIVELDGADHFVTTAIDQIERVTRERILA